MTEVNESPAVPERRVTDREREQVVARLRAAVSEGSLDLDELGERITSVYQARTAGELDRVTRDLPVPSSAPSPRRRSIWRNGAFRMHATVYGLVNGFLVGTWAVTGADFFWPFFPAASWGIGLGAHAMATVALEGRRHRGRLKRASRRQLRPAAPGPALTAGGHRNPTPRLPGVDRAAVLFTDIVGSTQLTTALGDDGWRRLRAGYRKLVGDCLRAHGGVEVNVAGDGILARFPTEAAAVRCAVDIHRALRHQRDGTGFAPSARTAVHVGDVAPDGDDLVGAAVNLVCRVAGEAEPDEVLVTEAVAERLDDRFAVRDLGLRQLKGHAEARHLFAVDHD